MENRLLGLGPLTGKESQPKSHGNGYNPLSNPTVERGRKAIEDSIVEHPSIGLATAVVVGIVIGWFIKRR